MSDPQDSQSRDNTLSAPFTAEVEEITDDISDVNVLDIPVLLVFVLLLVIVGLQFFTRYILNDSLGWTEEIARYFLILLGFIGGITCIRNDKHIYLEFAYHYLPTLSIKPIILITRILVMGFWGYAGWLGIELAEKTNSNMASINVPKSYLYYVIVASCFLMGVFALVRLIHDYYTPARILVGKKLQQNIADN